MHVFKASRQMFDSLPGVNQTVLVVCMEGTVAFTNTWFIRVVIVHA